MANAPAFALVWNGEMEPLAQYRTCCQIYGDRDPGCVVGLGGKSGTPIGIDQVDAGRATLGMAVMVRRQVVDDLIFREDKDDRWEVLGTPGRGMAGDCDDVGMTTIVRLLRRGFPRAALRATIVRLPGTAGHHLILSVKRQGEHGVEEIFLDDRHHSVMRPEQLADWGYVFIAQEVPGRRDWQRATHQPALMVADRGD
ncbi:MAG: transglutaminase-like cysteine peptidase [Niveispirillum sp.]